MTQHELLEKLSFLKPKYKQEGFEIIGLFGSYAKNSYSASSDVDILYKIDDLNGYFEKYPGWEAINHIVEVKEQLKHDLATDIDFVDIESLNEIGKKYILQEVINV